MTIQQPKAFIMREKREHESDIGFDEGYCAACDDILAFVEKTAEEEMYKWRNNND